MDWAMLAASFDIDLSASEFAQIAAAGATLILAGVTAWMAVKTRAVAEETKSASKATQSMANETARMAEAADKQAKEVAQQVQLAQGQLDAATRALRASIRPWLTVHYGPKGEYSPSAKMFQGEAIALAIRLINVGPGIAIVTDCWACGRTSSSQEAWKRMVRGWAQQPSLSTAESTYVEARVSLTSSEWRGLTLNKFLGGTRREFGIDVRYEDGEGGQPVWATFHLGTPFGGRDFWRVTTITYRRDGEEAAFASASSFLGQQPT